MSYKYDLQEIINHFLKGVDVYHRFGSVEFNNMLTEQDMIIANVPLIHKEL